MCFSIGLLAEEKRIAESYAKMRSMSLEEAFKQALFERIEKHIFLLLRHFLKSSECVPKRYSIRISNLSLISYINNQSGSM